jgi:hypothetical protein
MYKESLVEMSFVVWLFELWTHHVGWKIKTTLLIFLSFELSRWSETHWVLRYIGFWSENWRPEICSVSANGQSTTWPKLNAGDLVGSETEKNLLQLSDRKMIGINAVAT